jgi:hypothetical protein
MIAAPQTLLDTEGVERLMQPRNAQEVRDTARAVIADFLRGYPQDRDAQVFAAAHAAMAT